KLWEARQVRKEYYAIVHGELAQDHGVIDCALAKDQRSRVAIKDCVRSDGAPATTEYWVKKRFKRSHSGPSGASVLPFTLVRIVPLTGRKHQIRIHLADIGHSVVGDKLYGGNEDLYLAFVEDRLTAMQRQELILPFHALHAGEVRFTWQGEARAYC